MEKRSNSLRFLSHGVMILGLVTAGLGLVAFAREPIQWGVVLFAYGGALWLLFDIQEELRAVRRALEQDPAPSPGAGGESHKQTEENRR